MPRLPDDILERIPDLQRLCGDPAIARAVRTRDPFQVYRALAWARLRGRLAPHRRLLDDLVERRHLFFRPLHEGLAGTPPLPWPFGAWLFAWGYAIALGLCLLAAVALNLAALRPELAAPVRLPRIVAEVVFAYLAVNGVLFLRGLSTVQPGGRRTGQVALDGAAPHAAVFRRVLDLNLFLLGLPAAALAVYLLVRR